MSITNVQGRRRSAIAVPLAKGTVARTIDVETMDKALNDVCGDLYQVMGIVRMATETIREPTLGERSITAAWTALDGAYKLLDIITDRLQTSETMLAEEVPHGE